MAGNAENLKTGYDAFARGDMETVLGLWHDDIRWEAGHPDTGVPGAGVHEGKQAVMEFFGLIPQNWEEFSVTPDETLEQGDTVVVLGHTDAKPKNGGEKESLPFVHIWRFEGGKVKRVQSLTDTARVKQTLGL